MAKTPYLDAIKLASILSDGGYSTLVSMSEASNLLLLSGLVVLRMKWLWENPIAPISDALYNLILEFIEEAEADLMTNINVGTIFPSVALLTDPQFLLMFGQLVPQVDYPELTTAVPPVWLVGSDIQIPDMRDTFVQGAQGLGDFGTVMGENDVTLTEAEMPSHTHIQNPHSHTYNDETIIPFLAVPGPEPVSLVTPIPAVTGGATAINQSTGGGGAHNNVPLSLQVAWYIVAR